jgi:hypothetical protein
MHAADPAIESGMVFTANLDLSPAMMTVDIVHTSVKLLSLSYSQ